MIAPRFIVGFTGHRSVENHDSISSALHEALQKLKGMVVSRGGVLEYYGSIAWGADTLAVEEARKLGIPVHLVLPKPVVHDPESGALTKDAGFAEDFWDGKPGKGGTFRQDDWDRAWKQIEDARQGTDGGTLRLVRGTQTEPECYYDAGLQVLDAADVMLAVWDHKDERGLGGTAQMVELARKKQMPHLIIHAVDGSAQSDHLDSLAAEDGSSEVIHEVDQFSIGCSCVPEGKPEGAQELFKRLEICSNRESKRFRHALVRMILAHGAATLVAAIAAILPHHSLGWTIALAVLSLIEACLVGWALSRAWMLKSGHVHERWMQTRFAAELMRGLRESRGLLDPLHPLIKRHQARWARFSITVGLLIRRSFPPYPNWSAARRAYVDNRLNHDDPTIGQIKYFASKQAEAEPHFHSTLRWGTFLGRAALFFVLGALIFKCWMISLEALHPDDHAVHNGWKSWHTDVAFKLFPIALPLAAGIFISLRSALDSGRRTYRYKEFTDRLKLTAAAMETLKTEASVRRHVAATEEVLLDELIEWHLAEQQNGAH